MTVQAQLHARRISITIVFGLIAAAVAVLNIGGPAPQAAQARCTHDGQQSPSPSGSTSGTSSPSPSTSTGGILPTGLPTGLPTSEPSSSESTSASPSGSPQQETSRCESRITISYVERFSNQDRRSAFKGRVRSDDSLCISNRKVILKKKTANGSKRAGRTVTNPRGQWRIFKDNPRGRYFAQTTQARRASDHGDHICEAARSRTIRP